ncbi:MAG: glycosyltransferase [candidate division KSB1 bacterium]|nr:glycosyltransferase [candidate division KSB1 bacterium]
MAVLTLLLGILGITYSIVGLWLLRALRRSPRGERTDLPRVTVVVAARDEEANLPYCLASLAVLDYPLDRLEIVLVDHDSRDRTPELLASFCARHPHARVVHVSDGVHTLCGKAAAVAAGIEHSHGEIILLTDADCAVPRNWVRSLVRYFSEGVGMVCGFTTVDGRGGHFAQAQALDWLYLLAAAAGAGIRGRPLTWVGNNLAFRRQAYDEVGGYSGVGFSLTEDFALFKAICATRRWDVRFVTAPEALVLTRPRKGWRELFRQRLRWAVGGKSVAPLGKVLLALGGGVRLLLGPALVLAPLRPTALLLPVTVLLTDMVILARMCRSLGLGELLRAFVRFEALIASYMVAGAALLPWVRALRWKGTTYPVGRGAVSPPPPAPVPRSQRTEESVESHSWS